MNGKNYKKILKIKGLKYTRKTNDTLNYLLVFSYLWRLICNHITDSMESVNKFYFFSSVYFFLSVPINTSTTFDRLSKL